MKRMKIQMEVAVLDDLDPEELHDHIIETIQVKLISPIDIQETGTITQDELDEIG